MCPPILYLPSANNYLKGYGQVVPMKMPSAHQQFCINFILHLTLFLLLMSVALLGCRKVDVLDVNGTATAEFQQTQTIEAIPDTPTPTPLPTLDPNITPSPTPCVANLAWQDEYEVQPGDTLGSIAIAAGVTIKDMEDNNCLVDRDLLRAGDVLKVPNAIAIDIASSPQGLEGVVIFVGQAETGSLDLWTIKSDGSALRQITEHGVIIGRPIRSPDNDWVAYRTLSPFYEEAAAANMPLAPFDIWLIQVDGTRQFQVVEQGPTDFLVRSQPAWSLDSERLVYTEQSKQRGALVLIRRDGTDRFVLQAGNFAAPNTINPIPPAWSPDGTQIAYMKQVEEQLGLYIINPDGTNNQLLDSGFAVVQGPYWIPFAGEGGDPAIAYQIENGSQTIWRVVNPQTGEVVERDSRLVMVAPTLAWRIRPGTDRLLLLNLENIPQAVELLPDFSTVSWGTLNGQLVAIDSEGDIVFHSLTDGFTKIIMPNGGAQSLVWTEPLWLLLP